MKSITIQAEKRTDSGKKAAKAARNEGMVPCVLYGGNETVAFKTEPRSFKEVIYSADFKTISLELDGKTHRCILKDVQFHPVTDELLHVDLLRLIDGHPVRVELPIRTKGNSPGVKLGGKLQVSMRKVKVKANPENLVHEVFVDVSKLGLGQAVRVRDIEVPEGIQIMSATGTPVASVEIPRALRSAASKAEATPGAAPAAPAAE